MVLKKIDYQFKHEQLSYDAKPNYQPCVKLSFYFSKLPNVSYEQFHRHWETVHADLTVAAKDFKACKLQRYVQFHQTPEMKEKARSLGLNHLEYDGCSEIWVKEWDDWLRFFEVSLLPVVSRSFDSSDGLLQSPEYAKALGPDCGNFMAMPISVRNPNGLVRTC